MNDQGPKGCPARVVFHIDPEYLGRFRNAEHLALFLVIEQLMAARGRDVVIAPRPARDLPPEARWGDGDLHIVQGGTARGVGYLNAGLAYLTGYWHLDPQGVLADSSARLHGFDPALVDLAAATAFHAHLVQRFVARRKSRYRQSRIPADLPQGCIAVFLQGPSPGLRGHQFMGQRAMLRSVIAGACGRKVVVKAHPVTMEHGQRIMADLRAEGLDFIEASPNVHDLLAACAASVSINSAAAIEGFLHGKPAILFGRSDFADQAETVRKPDEFAAALDRALTMPRDYIPWLHWYFTRFCLDLDAPDLHSRILDIFDQAGFGADNLFAPQ